MNQGRPGARSVCTRGYGSMGCLAYLAKDQPCLVCSFLLGMRTTCSLPAVLWNPLPLCRSPETTDTART